MNEKTRSTMMEIIMEEDIEILRYFTHDHLPTKLSAISHPFQLLAGVIIENIPISTERHKALRKLLEAKDCAIRAAL